MALQNRYACIHKLLVFKLSYKNPIVDPLPEWHKSTYHPQTIEDLLAKEGIFPTSPAKRNAFLAELTTSECLSTCLSVRKGTRPVTITHALITSEIGMFIGEIGAVTGIDVDEILSDRITALVDTGTVISQLDLTSGMALYSLAKRNQV